MSKKVVGIDASMLVYTGSGVANYTFNLIRALLKYARHEYDYKVFYSSRRIPKDTQRMLQELKSMGAKVYQYPFPPWILKIIWNIYQMVPVEWLIGKIDYYHSSDFLRPPLSSRVKPITTVHDLTWKKFPDFHTQDVIDGHARKLELTIKGNDIIICDSENTKKDLLEYYPKILELNEVAVIYPDVDEKFRVMEKDEYEPILKKYGIEPGTDYLLYVGAIEPRKNIPLTIDVFHEFIKDEKYTHFKLMLVGRAGWKNEEVFQKIKRLALEDKVQFVGYVDDEELPALYNGTRCLLYLSKYEGFGLPPLEALQCNVPVLCADNSSLKEIVPPQFLVDVNTAVEVLVGRLAGIIETKPNVHLHQVNSMYNWTQTAGQFISIFRNNSID